MTFIRKIYYFLGSIYFAIMLIATTASFVIAGTILESSTDSHKYASHFTYGSPIFSMLLWGFFLNILISALRRWPFKYQHLPFLITHWGMLMVLSGTLIKNYFGVQGTMSIIEGSASQEIFLPDTFVVQIEKMDPSLPSRMISKKYPLPKANSNGKAYPLKGRRSYLDNLLDKTIENDDKFSELQVQLLSYSPHSSEKIETWIKQDKAWIAGIKPFEVYNWSVNQPLDSPKINAKLWNNADVRWNLLAYRTEDVDELARLAYSKYATIAIEDTVSGNKLFEGPLETVLSKTLQLSKGIVSLELNFNWSSVLGFQDPNLLVKIEGPLVKDVIKIPLQGPEALTNKNELRPSLGMASLTAAIHIPPTLLIVEDPQGDVFLFAFDPHGRVFTQPFRSNNLNEVLAYEHGLGGYAVQTKIPFSPYPCGRKEIQAAQLHTLVVQVRQNIASPSGLTPPLKVLYDTCTNLQKDFATTFVQFLDHWNKYQGWLYPGNVPLPESLQEVFAELDWSAVQDNDRKGCSWTSSVFNELDPKLSSGQDLIQILDRLKWPLLYSIISSKNLNEPSLQEDWQKILEKMTAQIFSVANQLPDSPQIFGQLSKEMQAAFNARLLSAYLRAYSIHLTNILQPGNESDIHDRVKFYLASQIFTHKTRAAISPLDTKPIKEQAAFIASLPGDSATYGQIYHAYGEMLHVLKLPDIIEQISPKDLAEAFQKFSPLTPIDFTGKDCSQILTALTHDPLDLESPATLRHSPERPLKKIEDNLPRITLKLTKGSYQEYITLSYDRFGAGLKWPALRGEYLIRFQPEYQTIPYRVRLRQARQINYPNSQQAFSYESDLIVTDTINKNILEKTISMNNVHETWDGYRFYLSNIAPANEASVKKVQIVVDQEPCKICVDVSRCDHHDFKESSYYFG